MSANETLHIETLLIYKEALAQREEVERHKWLESEKVGRDIGYDAALIDWVIKHKSKWKKAQRFFKIRLD
jgi:hypothetical protein